MKTNKDFIWRLTLLLMMTLGLSSLYAANYDLRFVVNEYDCQNLTLLVDIEIKASQTSSDFHLGGQNYRFTFNPMSINNPVKHSELTISGLKVGDGYNAFYQPHNMTGTIGNTVSYNIQLSNGNGYIVKQQWVAVGRIKFDVVNINAPFNLNWNPSGGPAPTIVVSPNTNMSQGQLAGKMSHQREVDLRVFLEGPYQPTKGTMSTYLNLGDGSLLHRGVLPGQAPLSPDVTMTPAGQPYNNETWGYTGTEGSNIHVYDPTVVDWVMVVFRSGTPGAPNDVLKAAALLHDDGKVELLSDLDFSLLPSQYYIKIVHRNHMPIMTAAPIMNDECGSIGYDFTTQDSYKTETTFGQKEIAPGIYAMYAGNTDVLGDAPGYGINGADKILWEEENGYFDTYKIPDFNLDSEVNALDKLLWYDNNGYSSAVKQ